MQHQNSRNIGLKGEIEVQLGWEQFEWQKKVLHIRATVVAATTVNICKYLSLERRQPGLSCHSEGGTVTGWMSVCFRNELLKSSFDCECKAMFCNHSIRNKGGFLIIYLIPGSISPLVLNQNGGRKVGAIFFVFPRAPTGKEYRGRKKGKKETKVTDHKKEIRVSRQRYQVMQTENEESWRDREKENE